MKAGCWDTPLALWDLAEAIPVISDNGLPLLTENNFQTPSPHPHSFYLDPLYWYLRYLSDPPPLPYYLELENKKKLSNTLRPNFCFLKIIHLLQPR